MNGFESKSRLELIGEWLDAHGITYRIGSPAVDWPCIMARDVYTGGFDWKMFDETTTIDEIKVWLGY